jgi:hypothetical protein
MDIRVNRKYYKKIYKIWEKSTAIDKNKISLNIDEKAIVPVIMVKNEKGIIVEWTRGIANVKSFIEYGYVRIIKKCPYKFGNCIAEKCQLFQTYNGTGDCAHNWTAMGIWNIIQEDKENKENN